MKSERYMFINEGESDVVLEIKAYENIGVFAMRTDDGGAEELVATHEVPEGQQAVVFDLKVPAGAICGFVASATPDFTNPTPERLQVMLTPGKDPWPTVAPALVAQRGYAAQYASFLLGQSGTR